MLNEDGRPNDFEDVGEGLVDLYPREYEVIRNIEPVGDGMRTTGAAAKESTNLFRYMLKIGDVDVNDMIGTLFYTDAYCFNEIDWKDIVPACATNKIEIRHMRDPDIFYKMYESGNRHPFYVNGRDSSYYQVDMYFRGCDGVSGRINAMVLKTLSGNLLLKQFNGLGRHYVIDPSLEMIFKFKIMGLEFDTFLVGSQSYGYLERGV